MKTIKLLLTITLALAGQVQAQTSNLITTLVMQFTSAQNLTTPVLPLGGSYFFLVTGRYGTGPGDRGEAMADAAYGTVITDTLDHYHNPGHGWLWNGIATNRPTPDVYQTNHVYRFDFTGRGAAELLTFTDPVYGDNVGSLTFELYELVQAPAFLWTKLAGHTNLPTGWRSMSASADANRGIIYSLSGSGVFWKYDIRSNAFTQLPVSGWPGGSTFIYNPDENTIWLTLNGRGQVYRLPVTGGAVTSVGASGAPLSDGNNACFWNPVTHKLGAAFGYGWGAVRNWRWEFGTNDADWVQIEANSPGREPWCRTEVNEAFDVEGKRVFVFAGNGNSSGTQGQFDPGFANNGSQFDYLKDLWVLNLQSNQWSKLIPLNTSIPIVGGFVYAPPLDSLLMINGYQIPANANPSVPVTGLWSFHIGSSTNWIQVAATGDIPNASDEIQPNGSAQSSFYDSLSQRIIHFNNAGVYALSLTSPSNALNLPPMTLISAASDSANNTYVLGTFTNTVSVGGKSLTSLGGTDYVLAQYRPDGTAGWAIGFGTPQDEQTVYTTLNVTSNAIFVSGESLGSIHITDTASNVVNTAYNTGDKADGFLLRFSLAGVAQWQASLTSIGNENGAGVSLDTAGNVYWVGSFNGCCPSQGGATLTGGDGTSLALTTPSYGTAFLTKMSPAGKSLWVVKAYNRDVQFVNIAVDGQGNSYVLGWGSSTSSGTPTTVVNADGSTGAISNPGTQFGFLAKFNAGGIMQWSVTPVGGLEITYRPICITSGGAVVWGARYSLGTLTLPSTDANNLQLPAASGYDGFVAQYDANGKADWAAQIPGTSNQSVVAISSVNSNVWVGGLTTGGISLSGISLTPAGTQNIFVLQMNTNGQVLSGDLLGGTGSDVLTSLQVAGSSLSLIAGNQGGNFQGWGSGITTAGPFVLMGYLPSEPPTITTQPQSATANAGANVAFNVTATGTTPLTYQWSLNGTNISGATNSSYNLASATTNNAGTYTVIVSNAGGSVTSSNAVLTVIPPPRTGTGTATLVGVFVVSVNITDGGSGYTNTPLVRFVGGGGSGAQAFAVVSNGVITAINVLDAGYGYTNAPLVVIAPPFIPNPVLGIAPMSFLAFSNLTVGGAYQLQRSAEWYWTDQPVSFTATDAIYTQVVAGIVGSGDYRLALNPVPAQAFATAQVVNGFVVGATVTSGGSGYVTGPAITIVGGGGTNATAISHVSGGVVTGISITDAGIGYTNTPTVEIAQPPAAAVSPTVLPVMRVDSTNLAPYDNYQIQFRPAIGGAWVNWNGGLFTPTDVTSSQYLFITNGAGFFRLQYAP